VLRLKNLDLLGVVVGVDAPGRLKGVVGVEGTDAGVTADAGVVGRLEGVVGMGEGSKGVAFERPLSSESTLCFCGDCSDVETDVRLLFANGETSPKTSSAELFRDGVVFVGEVAIASSALRFREGVVVFDGEVVVAKLEAERRVRVGVDLADAGVILDVDCLERVGEEGSIMRRR
jgi:hypothetical protein